jgi:hypothetical protein
MTSNEEVARRFSERDFPKHGKELNGSHFFIRDEVLYSYGEHFPVAMWLTPYEVLFNDDGYSVTTRKHKSVTKYALSKARPDVRITRVSTSEFKDILHRRYAGQQATEGQKVVFVVRPLEYEKVTFTDMKRLLPVFLKEQAKMSTRKANRLAKESCESWERAALLEVL